MNNTELIERLVELERSMVEKRDVDVKAFEEKQKREHDEADMTGDNSDRHKCRTCQYRHSDAGGCDYCIHTGKERGCDVEVCDKALVGERLTKK